ncbi:MAG: type III pantothenate kinase [Methylococcales bacterium]|nr:type III pantothenate kinase [Methylococcales bacterium]
MRLLVDIGNSRVKWACCNAGLWQLGQPLSHQDAAFVQRLRDCWQVLNPAPERVVIAAVGAASVLNEVIRLSQALWSCPIRELVSSGQALGVVNGYQEPASLGVDRWLALLAAARRYPDQAVCVVDLGTAMTVDMLDAHHHHLGGVIVPGLALMRSALSQGTAALPASGAIPGMGLADHTEQGMAYGAMWAAVGLIEQIMTHYAALRPRLILTGGDAVKVEGQLSRPYVLITDLVLQGMQCVEDESD